MESDFITRQHIESLTPDPDPNFAEVLNNYKFPPVSNPSPPPMIGYNGYPPYFGAAPVSSNNDMLLGSILGQLQANQQKPATSNLDGLQININLKVLSWILIILLLAVLIWLALRAHEARRNPLKQRLRKLEKQFKKMRKLRRNPEEKAPALEDSFEDSLLELDEEL